MDDISSTADAEIRNALAAMRSAAELLRDVGDLGPDDRRRFAGIVIEEGRRVEALLNAADAV
ncbi:MAG: histidine kinase dimerization/phospho-acceptor domain-containing protein [Pseudomonadota bacterium]